MIRMIDWSSLKLVRALSDDCVPIFREFATELNTTVQFYPAGEYLLPKEKIKVENLECPEGLELMKLTMENTQEVDDHWTYRS
jgi:hypothetical protein